jgi:hypothetical protein
MSELFDILRSFSLHRPDVVYHRLMNMPDYTLSRMIDKYIQVAMRRPLAYQPKSSTTNIYPDSFRSDISMDIIKQLSLYANKIYVHDSFLESAMDWQNWDSLRMSLSNPSASEVDLKLKFKKILAQNIIKTIELEPLVNAGIVYMTPASSVYGYKNRSGLYSDDFFQSEGNMDDVSSNRKPFDGFSEAFKQYFVDHIKVLPAKFVDRKIVLDEGDLTPRRAIFLGFDKEDRFHEYYMMHVTPDPESQDDGAIMMFLPTEDIYDIDESMFWNWVESVKEKIARERLWHIQNDLIIARNSGSNFITDSPNSYDMVLLGLGVDTSSMPINFLDLEIPYIQDADLQDIIKARQNELAFEEFRLAMDKAITELNAISDENAYQSKVKEIQNDLLRLPIKRVEEKMSSLKRSLFVNGTVLVGVLSTALLSDNVAAKGIGFTAALVEALKMYNENKIEEDTTKQSANYFFWNATRKARKR